MKKDKHDDSVSVALGDKVSKPYWKFFLLWIIIFSIIAFVFYVIPLITSSYK